MNIITATDVVNCFDEPRLRNCRPVKMYENPTGLVTNIDAGIIINGDSMSVIFSKASGLKDRFNEVFVDLRAHTSKTPTSYHALFSLNGGSDKYYQIDLDSHTVFGFRQYIEALICIMDIPSMSRVLERMSDRVIEHRKWLRPSSMKMPRLQTGDRRGFFEDFADILTAVVDETVIHSWYGRDGSGFMIPTPFHVSGDTWLSLEQLNVPSGVYDETIGYGERVDALKSIQELPYQRAVILMNRLLLSQDYEGVDYILEQIPLIRKTSVNIYGRKILEAAFVNNELGMKFVFDNLIHTTAGDGIRYTNKIVLYRDSIPYGPGDVYRMLGAESFIADLRDKYDGVKTGAIGALTVDGGRCMCSIVSINGAKGARPLMSVYAEKKYQGSSDFELIGIILDVQPNDSSAIVMWYANVYHHFLSIPGNHIVDLSFNDSKYGKMATVTVPHIYRIK